MMEGIDQSHMFERWIVAVLVVPMRVAGKVLSFGFGLFDTLLSLLGELFLGAQAQSSYGNMRLTAELMTELTGIKVDPEKLYSDFKNKGRLAGLQDTGGAFFNALASEFAGVTQVTEGNAWHITPGAGVGGLPVHGVLPGDGVKAAQAMFGFAATFAAREGNIDMLTDIPFVKKLQLFDIFRDFAVVMSKSVGIARLLRVAVRPLMQIMVAEPLTHDLNTQYRPTFLKPAEAVRAWASGFITLAEFQAEMAAAGYSDSRISALSWQHEKMPSVQELELLRAGHAIDPQDEKVWFHRLGYTDEVIALLQKARDLEPARRLSLRYLEHYLEQYLQGHLTQASVNSFLDAMAASNRVLVTPGELEAVRALVALTATATLRPRHLTIAQLQLAYIDGTITLQDFDQHLVDLGYSADDATTLGIETLIKAKDKAAAAAAKAAKGKHGKPAPASGLATPPTTGA